MSSLRRFLKLPIIMPFPSGMTAAGASEFSLQALMSNANAYAEEYVSVTTAGTSTTLTAAQFLAKNIILATGASGNFTLTLPATSKIIDALGPTMPRNGAFYFPVYVANNTAYVATLTAGDSSTTFSGSAQIASNVTAKWMVHVVAPTNAQGVFTLVAQRIQSSGSGSVGIGTVTQVSVVTANGVSGSVANDTTTPAITLTLGAITPTTVNGLTVTTTTGTLTLANGSTLAISGAFSGTLTLTGATNVTLPTSGTLMANPMTTGGDVIYGGASGVATRLANGTAGQVLTSAGTTLAPTWATPTTGTVTTVSVVTANGVSGSVANPTTTPAITLTLGAITPTTVNGLTITSTNGTLTLANGSSLVTSGANSITFTSTGTTSVTLPTAGTLMANPMTTGGDVIYGGASGLPTRLANGTAGQVLTSAGTTLAPTWTSLVTGVSSVTAANATLTISPTTGAVVAGINLNNANTWTQAITIATTASATMFVLDGTGAPLGNITINNKLGGGGRLVYDVFDTGVSSATHTIGAGLFSWDLKLGGNSIYEYLIGSVQVWIMGSNSVRMSSAIEFDWSSTTSASGTPDVALSRDSAGLLVVNEGVAPRALRDIKLRDIYTNDATFLLRTNTTLTNAAGAQAATILNGPAAGNPTKWIGIDDNGTTRYIPAW